MKILHAAAITPQLCGLYETCRELAAAERALGHDARIYDPKNPISLPTNTDRGVPVTAGRPNFVDEADVIVSHSGLNEPLRESNKPVVHVLHGRPRSSFLLERLGKTAVLSFLREERKNPQYKAFVTFWPTHKPYWDMVVAPHVVKVINPPVDLNAWTPDGPRGYGFHGHKGTVNIVSADIWREDKDSFDVLMAACLYAKRNPGTKIHLYGVPPDQRGIGALTDVLKEHDALGEVCGRVIGLANVYRAATVAISPQSIATRSIREAMACGCPVVAGDESSGAPWHANPEHTKQFADYIEIAAQDRPLHSKMCRVFAEAFFNPEDTANGIIRICEDAIQCPSK